MKKSPHNWVGNVIPDIYPKPLFFFIAHLDECPQTTLNLREKPFHIGLTKKKKTPTPPNNNNSTEVLQLVVKSAQDFRWYLREVVDMAAWKFSFFFGKEIHPRNLSYQKMAIV